MAWREELHPRDEHGRFTHKGGLSAVSIKNTLANLHMASDDDLIDVFGRLSRTKQIRARDLRAIDAELARREGGADLPAPEDTPEQKRVDDLVRRGWSYADAYADTYGGSAEKMRAEERNTGIDRRRGETPEQARRRAYSELVALECLQAEEATNGYLTSRRCQGIEPETLWSGPASRARKCASEELLRWWDANGGRKTYAVWRAHYVGGRSAKQAADRSRLASSGKDFG